VAHRWVAGEHIIDIDTVVGGTALYVVSANTQVTQEGRQTIALRLSNVDRHPVDNAQVVSSTVRKVRRLQEPAGDSSVTVYKKINSADVNIDGGTIDGTIIGATTPATGDFTWITCFGISVNTATGPEAGMVYAKKGVLTETDGSTGGFWAGSGLDCQWYRHDASHWRTPDKVTVDNGINVGSETLSAGAGEVRVTTAVSVVSDTEVTNGYFCGSTYDLVLYRGGANLWRTPDSVAIDADLRLGTTTDHGGLLNLNEGTTAADGIYFGTGVTLYRSAADMLKTDDGLTGFVASRRCYTRFGGQQ
jgi:hypothetical protein